MKTVAAPIPFAGSQLRETRHVCAFFNSDDEEYRVLLPFIKDGFQCGDKAVHVVYPSQHRIIYNDRPQQKSTQQRPKRVASSNFGPTPKHIFGTAFSIQIECWKCSSNWPAAMPREDFRSVALSATWIWRPKVDPTSRTSLNSNRV